MVSIIALQGETGNIAIFLEMYALPGVKISVKFEIKISILIHIS